jgi:hypothetical protein
VKTLTLFLFLFSFLPSLSWAELQIPKNLTADDRHRMTELLGLSTGEKILGNPYPLGGYAGIEVGYEYQVVSTTDISSMGDKSSSTSEVGMTQLTLGKGLYNNVDLYLQFTPFSQGSSVTGYGGQIRWGFYQAEYLPAHLSLVLSADSTNFENKATFSTQGGDLVAGFTVQDITLYAGLGWARAFGNFIGGANGITDDQATDKSDASSMHYLAGMNVKYDRVFIALELDRYTDANYAAKLGCRF